MRNQVPSGVVGEFLCSAAEEVTKLDFILRFVVIFTLNNSEQWQIL